MDVSSTLMVDDIIFMHVDAALAVSSIISQYSWVICSVNALAQSNVLLLTAIVTSIKRNAYLLSHLRLIFLP